MAIRIADRLSIGPGGIAILCLFDTEAHPQRAQAAISLMNSRSDRDEDDRDPSFVSTPQATPKEACELAGQASDMAFFLPPDNSEYRKDSSKYARAVIDHFIQKERWCSHTIFFFRWSEKNDCWTYVRVYNLNANMKH
jgi:hypothetical protein